MMMQITPFYAGLLTLIHLWLSLRVVQARRLYKVSVGDGGEREIVKRNRAQSNWVEYAVIGVVLLGLLELMGANALLLHVFGLAMLLGRAAHAYGFSSKPQVVILRQIGMYLTVFDLLAMALFCIWGGLFW